MNLSLFTSTPLVVVRDNRGNKIRKIDYYRHPNFAEQTEERIEFYQFNTHGFLATVADPRQYVKQQVNFNYRYNLLGFSLQTQGIDNGTVRVLNDSAGRLLLSLDANNLWRTFVYETSASLGRLTHIWEKTAEQGERISDYLEYAGNSFHEQNANLSGQCIRHYDTAGLLQIGQISLTGEAIHITRKLIQSLDNQDFYVNWNTNDRDGMLNPEPFCTELKNDATGANILSINAKGHQQRLHYDIAGQLQFCGLTIKGEITQCMIKSIEYSAAGQKLCKKLGNGVVTCYEYEPQTQRLIRFSTERANNHELGFKCFQDLRYQYDPVGNILCIRNDAEQTRFWQNQKIEPEQRFTYDTLYQLVSVTGREMANINQQRHASPQRFMFDSSMYTYYNRTYHYDKSGNLIESRHRTPAIHSGYTIKMTVSDRSNRAIDYSLAMEAKDVDAFFTQSGQQKQLMKGQTLDWTARQELLSMRGETIYEQYRYGSDHQRIFKLTEHNQQIATVIYLPNLELKNINHQEKLQVIHINETNGMRVQVLHWEQGKPKEIDNNSIRYSIDSFNGNSGLELDSQGNLISLEEYYPYGGTAVWLVRNDVEADYKTIRYSGKELDATGLYYYGHRYYQPWCGRWLSADPGGTVDGLNLFRMTRNNPLKYQDNDGLNPIDRVVGYYQQYNNYRAKSRANQSYQIMSLGERWLDNNSYRPVFNNLETFFAHTQENMVQIRTKVGDLSDDERGFVDNFTKLDFTLLHFSDQQFLKPHNRATFRSRNELIKKGILSACETNTTPSDVLNLKTVDFAFFSLGIRGVRGKTRSEFGDNLYVTSVDDITGYKYMNYSHMAINDTLDFYRRETDIKRLTARFPDDSSGVAALKSETIAESAINTLYSFQDFRTALALRIVDSARLLSSESQLSVYETSTNDSFDQLISLFYRPQMLVPKKLKSKATTVSNVRLN
ncbi:TPA: RHS repeat protein [Providencia stuartii]|nr:RHS repeat protein [Providencia stuartii]